MTHVPAVPWTRSSLKPDRGGNLGWVDEIDLDIAEEISLLLAGRSVATAESCTAGRIAETLACVAGADEFLRGGLVAYQEPVKRQLLNVDAESVLSLECASQMAIGVCTLMGAEIGVSTTGVAGEEPEGDILPGTVFVGVAIDGTASAQAYVFDGQPTEICDRGKRQALHDLLRLLRESDTRTT